MKKSHSLHRLLSPKSIALVGVSPREGTVGNDMLNVIRNGGFDGKLFFVNPRYEEINGQPCFASLSDIGQPIDMAILSVASHRMESLIDEAIACQVGGAVIFDYCKIEGETENLLIDRIAHKAKKAGLPICGGNCMGYYNFDERIHASFQSPGSRKPGHISLIAHSGSIFVLPTSNDPRYQFNLVVSAGQEINTTLDEYMDYALELESTRVLAVFMEAVRNPEGFVQVLEKAKAKNIPVVVTKVGRTDVSAKLAATHSGAIAGNNAAYEALFKKYGVICTDTLDDLMSTALVLSQGTKLGSGELGYISDSGGLRELFVDTAEQYNLKFAELDPMTIRQLANRLPLGLEPVNPLDAAGPFTPDYAEVFRDSVRYIMEDPNVALGVFEFEARDEFIYMPQFIEIAKEVRRYSNKPFIVINTFSGAINYRIAEDLIAHDIPLINGVENAAKIIAHLFSQRSNEQVTKASRATQVSIENSAQWRKRLLSGQPLSEAECLTLLSDYGISVAGAMEADTLANALSCAEKVGFPLVMKTAEPHIHHKSDVDGVKLNIKNADDVETTFLDYAERLGNRITLEPMIPPGIEIAFGMINDPQFGPMIMVSSGGIYIEILKDRAFSLSPISRAEAFQMINSLKVRPLLDGQRGARPVDLNLLTDALVKFSYLASDLSDVIEEIDVNPLIVSEHHCTAVDGLVIAKTL